MNKQTNLRSINILLVEDSETDILITREALEFAKLQNTLNVVKDGQAAVEYLKQKGEYKNVLKPDLILLDLNLPKKNGHEVLKEIKQTSNLKRIPVVMLTTSKAEEDIAKSYDLLVNCYVTKPVDFDQFAKVVRSIEHFWFTIVTLPEDED